MEWLMKAIYITQRFAWGQKLGGQDYHWSCLAYFYWLYFICMCQTILLSCHTILLISNLSWSILVLVLVLFFLSRHPNHPTEIWTTKKTWLIARKMMTRWMIPIPRSGFFFKLNLVKGSLLLLYWHDVHVWKIVGSKPINDPDTRQFTITCNWTGFFYNANTLSAKSNSDQKIQNELFAPRMSLLRSLASADRCDCSN